MMDKRLLSLVPQALRHVVLCVAFQWLGLLGSIGIAYVIAAIAGGVVDGNAVAPLALAGIGALSLVAKGASAKLAADQSYLASADVRRVLRHRIMEKVLAIGPSYANSVPTAEVVQLAVEGTEQLETYFAQYLPQLFYAVLAPLTLFVALLSTSVASAAVLLVFVPLIPVVIVIVQRIAKRILGTYWDEYANLADNFLENLQGLTTLKTYQADAARHGRMNAEAEHFREVTMKVLRMQLNSIIVMDVVALGGAAAGIGVALAQLGAGALSLEGCVYVILLSADFFIPMRRLGSYFHVAMNGMAAAQRIFALLDLEDPSTTSEPRTEEIVPGDHLSMHRVSFGYTPQTEVLHSVSMDIPVVGVTAIVGESGSGKSTVARLLAGKEDGYTGSLLVGGKEMRTIARADLTRYVTTVGTRSYLFGGSVRDNLMLADPEASDGQLWDVLESVSLADYLRTQDGLDTQVGKEGETMSGGQRQRLALARALLRESPVYILDEATSNIDVESEDAIMQTVRSVARYRAVVVISHRLATIAGAQRIYVLDQGTIVGSGTHDELLAGCARYRELWDAQQALEHYGARRREADDGGLERGEAEVEDDGR